VENLSSDSIPDCDKNEKRERIPKAKTRDGYRARKRISRPNATQGGDSGKEAFPPRTPHTLLRRMEGAEGIS